MSIEHAHKITARCWQCREPIRGPVCASCDVIQPPPPAPDLFAVLGLERRYTLDPADITAAWRELSRKVHPDRFVKKPAVYRRMSLQWTAAINQARLILTDPLSRARYLATGELAAPEEGGPVLDPAFLETIFALQFEAQMAPEATAAQARSMHAQVQAELEDTFARWEAGDGDLSSVPDHLARLKYIDNIIAAASP